MLDGQLTAIFGRVFGSIYLPATLHKRTLIDDGEGGYTTTTQDYPCRAQIDAVTEAMRQEPGYDSTDVMILVLEYGLEASIDTDCEITVKGVRRSIASVVNDPAYSYFQLRGKNI